MTFSTPEAADEELRCELEFARAERDLERDKVKQIDQMLKTVWQTHGVFLEELSQPHYLTNQELKLMQLKGIEALFIHWHKELKQIDRDGKRRYRFSLPKRHKPWKWLHRPPNN
jgi:hypothetical protein